VKGYRYKISHFAVIVLPGSFPVVGFGTTLQASVGLAILLWAWNRETAHKELLENKNKQDNVGMGDKKDC
jgi:hypothetical protein